MEFVLIIWLPGCGHATTYESLYSFGYYWTYLIISVVLVIDFNYSDFKFPILVQVCFSCSIMWCIV